MQSRLAVIALGALLVLLAAAPIGMGFGVEERYRALVAEADRSTEGVRVDGSIERGLWTSTAQTRIEIDRDGDPSLIVLDHVFSHGPVPLGEMLQGRSPLSLVAAVVDTGYAADPAELPRIAAALDGRPLMRLVSWLHLDESLSLLFTMPPLELEDGASRMAGVRAEARLEMGADEAAGWIATDPFSLEGPGNALSVGASRLRFAMRASDDPARAEGTVEIGAVSSSGAGGTLRMAPTSGRYASSFVGGAVGSGQGTLDFGEVTMGPADTDPAASATLRGLRLQETWGLDPDSGLRAFETTVSFETLSGVGTGAGSQPGYGPGRLEIAVRNVDPVAAQAFRDAMTTLEASGLDEGQLQPARQALFAEWMPRLFGPSPEISLDALSVESPQGEMTGRGRLRVDGSDATLLTDPTLLWLLTSADLELVIPRPFMQAIVDAYLIETVREDMGDVTPEEMAEMAAFMRDATLAQLVAQGLLGVDGETYRVDARLVDGVPTLNGQLVDLSRLVDPVAEEPGADENDETDEADDPVTGAGPAADPLAP